MQGHNEEWLGDCGAKPSKTTEDQPNAAIVIGTDVERKTLATITAKLALRGYALHELSDGTFLISTWNLCRPAACLREVRALASQLGAL